jgi:predicted enzyme related to lactoylglutathione lyase
LWIRSPLFFWDEEIGGILMKRGLLPPVEAGFLIYLSVDVLINTVETSDE